MHLYLWTQSFIALSTFSDPGNRSVFIPELHSPYTWLHVVCLINVVQRDATKAQGLPALLNRSSADLSARVSSPYSILKNYENGR